MFYAADTDIGGVSRLFGSQNLPAVSGTQTISLSKNFNPSVTLYVGSLHFDSVHLDLDGSKLCSEFAQSHFRHPRFPACVGVKPLQILDADCYVNAHK